MKSLSTLFKWVTDYVEEGSLEPDQFNRWGLGLYIIVPEHLIPKDIYGKVPYGYMRVAYICKKGTVNGSVPSIIHDYACQVLNTEDMFNLGLRQSYMFSNDVEELKKMVEQKIINSMLLFHGLIEYHKIIEYGK